MSKNLKIFLISTFGTFGLCLMFNSLSGNALTAKISDPLEGVEKKEFIPTIIESYENLKIDAKSVFSVFIDDKNEETILYEKNINEPLPIASITKLMTANVIFKNYDLSEEITVSKNAIDQPETFGQLNVGEIFTAGDLLYPFLIESSNDAGYSLVNDCDGMSEENFIELMNLETQNLGLINTSFSNYTGLDALEDIEPNLSTAKDLSVLVKNLSNNKTLWNILSLKEHDWHNRTLISTNDLLFDENFSDRIIGGKTGVTPRAGECLVLIIETPNGNGYIINIILGSQDRFGEMKKLISWIDESYIW